MQSGLGIEVARQFGAATRTDVRSVEQLAGLGGFLPTVAVPLMTREAFAAAVGLPVGVLVSQCERGYWPQVTIGRRVLINVEALRMHAIERGRDFAL